MDSPKNKQNAPGLRVGTVVAPAPGLAGVQSPDDDLIPVETLGPGVVEKVSSDGRVRVRWMDAEFDAWMEVQDVRSRGDHAHLVSAYRCDGRGRHTLVRRRVVETSGLDYNWTVEVRPRDIVRTVRSDGAAWTFRHNHLLRSIDPLWPQPPEDDDAEALAVAEIAVL